MYRRFQVFNNLPNGRTLALLLCVLSLMAAPLCLAQTNYAQATIRGTYSMIILPYGGALPTAGIGVITFDGTGQITAGRFYMNLTDARFDKRKIVETHVSGGSYTVDENGMGTVVVDGLPNTHWQLLIHEMEAADGSGAPRLAAGLRLTSDVVDPSGGNILTAELHRHPDNDGFTNDRINGLFVRRFTGHGGFTQLAAFGKVMIDRVGTVETLGSTILNLPGEVLGTRQVTGVPAKAALTIESDGLGRLDVEEGQAGVGEGHLVIVKAKRDAQNSLVGLEAFILFDELFDLGNITSGRATLQFIPD